MNETIESLGIIGDSSRINGGGFIMKNILVTGIGKTTVPVDSNNNLTTL